eukprot:968321-Pleurochrysis_carterae.AAC.4
MAVHSTGGSCSGWGACEPTLPLSIAAPIDFYGMDGALHANGRPFGLKGFNWFGSEGDLRVPAGLKERSATHLLQWASSNSFNALRLMFNWEDWDANEQIPQEHFSAQLNPGLVNATYRQMLLHIVRTSAERGILVLLACHRIQRSYGDDGPHAEWPGNWDGCVKLL